MTFCTIPLRKSLRLSLSACALLVHLTSGASVRALEHVETRGNVHEQILSGRVLVEAVDGGLLLESPDQELHLIEPAEIAKRSQDETPYERFDEDELAEELLAELPPGFQVHQSKNYTIAFNTTRSYAKWCSSLLERLNKGFLGYWGKLDADIAPPADPLVVIIFSDQQSYARYAAKELGPAVGSVIGYYSITSNRVLMYDLTGNQAIARERNSRGSLHQITAALSSPAAAPQVATIIHEATHQIAFNCGLQTRLADNPRWLSEGIALYCETPDLSSRGWRGIGKVNEPRWNQFRADYQNGKTLSLERMLTDDKLLADPQTAATAYAQAWAWNYYLIRHHRKQFVAYLEQLASKGQLVWDTPEQRLADFRKHFGEDEESLTADFYRQMSRIK